MTNRAYLYALSNQPDGFADRPETIQGLSEWPYSIPLAYYILLSGSPRVSGSLIEDGAYALTGNFAEGMERFERFAYIVRKAAAIRAAKLAKVLTDAIEFLASHKNRYLLLETVEIDWMDEADQREQVECHRARARAAGEAVDALSRNDTIAAFQFLRAERVAKGKFDPFKGLTLSDQFDNGDSQPMGVGYWNTVLFYELWNKAEFEAEQQSTEIISPREQAIADATRGLERHYIRGRNATIFKPSYSPWGWKPITVYVELPDRGAPKLRVVVSYRGDKSLRLRTIKVIAEGAVSYGTDLDDSAIERQNNDGDNSLAEGNFAEWIDFAAERECVEALKGMVAATSAAIALIGSEDQIVVDLTAENQNLIAQAISAFDGLAAIA